MYGEYFFALWPSEIQKLYALEERDWRPFFMVLLILLHRDYGPPPLLRTDIFWRVQTGHRTDGAWRRCRDRMSEAGAISIGADGSISAVWAERDWARRKQVSEQNSANGKRGGRPRQQQSNSSEPDTLCDPVSGDAKSENLLCDAIGEKTQQFQLLKKPTAERLVTDLDSNSDSNFNSTPTSTSPSSPAIPHMKTFGLAMDHSAATSAFDVERLKQSIFGVAASPALRAQMARLQMASHDVDDNTPTC